MLEVYKASKALWPEIKEIKLNTNADNKSARTLYEAEDFKESSVQPQHLQFMKAVQYEKDLS